MCAVGTSQQFCVRWNSHLGSLGAAFPQLLAGQRFVDVTLACEGHQLHCHRLVLAACSTYFESLLGENPCKHPIIILPRDIKLWEIQALVDFMYKGEVNVSQAGLSDLLKCAEILQIRGLCGSDAALNLNQVNNSNTATAMTTVGNTPSTQAGTNLTCSNIAAIASSATTASSLASSSESLASNSHHPSSSSSSSSNPISPSHINATMSVTSPSTGHVTDQSATDVHSPCPVTGVAVAAAAATMATSKSAAASSFATIKTSGGSDTNDGNNAANNAKKYTVNENSLLLRNVKNEQMHRSSTPNRIDKIEPSSIDDDMMDDGSDLNDMSTDKTEDDSYATKYIDYLDAAKNEFPLANVICEYDNLGVHISMDNVPGRRIRRSETLLRQAAECVTRGQTFQTVSDMFNIPISTIRFFMSRKGILPRRKRGRSAGITLSTSTSASVAAVASSHRQHLENASLSISSHNDSSSGGASGAIAATADRLMTDRDRDHHNRSVSPTEPPFHFATYKLPELKPKLL